MNYTPEQLAYVQSQLQQGISIEGVRVSLQQNGYSEEQINTLLQAAQSGGAPVAQGVAAPAQSKARGLPVWAWIIIVLLGLLVVAGIVLQLFVSTTMSLTESALEREFQESGIDVDLDFTDHEKSIEALRQIQIESFREAGMTDAEIQLYLDNEDEILEQMQREFKALE